MEHAVEEKPVIHMGLPISNGKLAMWLFLVTEIMFFTGLIGTYIILRNGQPTSNEPWPKPHQVHLIEWVGAFNTFVLICSSLTVVLAHWSLSKRNVGQAVAFITVTLILGGVFLVVKAFEYKSKYDHRILPGFVYDRVDGQGGTDYYKRVLKDLEESAQIRLMIEARDKFQSENGKMPSYDELFDLYLKKVKLDKKDVTGDRENRPSWLWYQMTSKGPERGLSAEEVARRVHDLVEDYPSSHLTEYIPFGNMWASCYFAMTGFHAIHVFGGLVVFAIILIMAARGRFGPQHESLVELTGLYWHFVDIVWIFLFPLVYLV
jgi:cytochrome c oxidase subunit 3